MMKYVGQPLTIISMFNTMLSSVRERCLFDNDICHCSRNSIFKHCVSFVIVPSDFELCKYNDNVIM